jgi:hypothetical protein
MGKFSLLLLLFFFNYYFERVTGMRNNKIKIKKLVMLTLIPLGPIRKVRSCKLHGWK